MPDSAAKEPTWFHLVKGHADRQGPWASLLSLNDCLVSVSSPGNQLLQVHKLYMRRTVFGHMSRVFTDDVTKVLNGWGPLRFHVSFVSLKQVRDTDTISWTQKTHLNTLPEGRDIHSFSRCFPDPRSKNWRQDDLRSSALLTCCPPDIECKTVFRAVA